MCQITEINSIRMVQILFQQIKMPPAPRYVQHVKYKLIKTIFRKIIKSAMSYLPSPNIRYYTKYLANCANVSGDKSSARSVPASPKLAQFTSGIIPRIILRR